MIAPNVARSLARTAKGMSGFCEATNHEHCRLTTCRCGCHQTPSAGVNVTGSTPATTAPGSKGDDTVGQDVRPDQPPAPPLGLHDDIPDAEYRAAEGLSASEAKILLGKRPPAPSPALAFGSLVHALVLEPHREAEYVSLDAAAIAGTNPKTGKPYDAPTMTGRWKAAVAEAEESGLTVVAQTDWDAARAMRDGVHAHRSARSVLDMCTRREVSGWAEHPSGVLVKGRIDLLGPGVVADLKTCQSADPATFGRACFDFGYHISMGHYAELAEAHGEEVQAVVILAVEKAEPYRVSVMELAPAAVDLGRERMAEACRRYAELGRVELPDFGSGFHSIDLPPWAYRDGADTTYQEMS